MTLVFATTNPGKLSELRGLLGSDFDVRSLSDFPPFPAVEEDGETFAQNAEKKALACARATGLPSLADDSGLCVDGLGGRPGVHSARYAPGDDRDRVHALLAELAQLGVAGEGRRAHFACALSIALPDGRVWTELGRCDGEISAAPRGEGGFGYDPVFWLPELNRSMGELSREEKAALSHRGRALRAMLPRLHELESSI